MYNRQVEAPMEEAQAKTNDIRDTIKAEILVREVEGLTAGTYIIHWTSVLSNHFDITGFKKVYGCLLYTSLPSPSASKYWQSMVYSPSPRCCQSRASSMVPLA